MFEAEKARQAEAKKEQQEKARNGGGGGRTPNSMNSQSPPGGSSGRGRSETVRYINDENGDENTLEVID